MPDGRIYITKSISMDPEVVELVKIRADELRMNFSEYINKCIENDIHRRGEPFVVIPTAVESRNTRQRHKRK